MPKANFFIVGAPKCGTTAWWHYLSQHPQVYMSPAKEPHYFCEDFPGFRWVKTRTDYDQLFEAGEDKAIRGEASVQYLYSKVAAEKIHAYNPDAKILICLRDHESFLRSYHGQLHRNLDEDESDLAVALEKESARRQGIGIPTDCREPQFLFYREVTRFSDQVSRYLEHFPHRQVAVIQLEDWIQAPGDAWAKIQEWLGLDNYSLGAMERVNEAKTTRSRALAKLYRRPPQVVLRAGRILRNAGFDTKRLVSYLKDKNESIGLSPQTQSLSLSGELENQFSKDKRRLTAMLESAPELLAITSPNHA